MPELRDKVVIEDAYIHKMLNNPQYLIAFPFLRPYAAAAKALAASCGRCGNRKARAKAIDYTEIKRSLAAMPPDRQAQLLQLAKTKSVRLVYRNRAGQVVKMTINAKA